MDAAELLIGLRLGSATVVAWMLWRVLFESWEITNRALEIRNSAWVYFRTSVLLVGFAVLCLATPENILRATGKIDTETSLWMMNGVSFVLFLYATVIHHGLDIANEKRHRTGAACLAILMSSIGYALWRSAT